ncbi:FtsH Extracellular [Epsilonproteobacteria bacterium SCGC AD-308-O04]|nr:FtsH Extracellular [Epsilonproteobacteria bacterium SCGC AD-308-O04]
MANNKKNDNNNFFNQNPLITFAIFSVVIILVFKLIVGEGGNFDNSTASANTRAKQVSYSEFKSLVASKSVSKVEIGQSYIKAKASDGRIYTTRIINGDSNLVEELDKQGIEYTGFSETNWFTEMFGWLFPFLMIIGIWMFFAGRMQKSMGGGILGMGNSKKMVNSEKPKTKFDDVAGVEEAKEEVQEIVDFLKYPARYVETHKAEYHQCYHIHQSGYGSVYCYFIHNYLLFIRYCYMSITKKSDHKVFGFNFSLYLSIVRICMWINL